MELIDSKKLTPIILLLISILLLSHIQLVAAYDNRDWTNGPDGEAPDSLSEEEYLLLWTGDKEDNSGEFFQSNDLSTNTYPKYSDDWNSNGHSKFGEMIDEGGDDTAYYPEGVETKDKEYIKDLYIGFYSIQPSVTLATDTSRVQVGMKNINVNTYVDYQVDVPKDDKNNERKIEWELNETSIIRHRLMLNTTCELGENCTLQTKNTSSHAVTLSSDEKLPGGNHEFILKTKVETVLDKKTFSCIKKEKPKDAGNSTSGDESSLPGNEDPDSTIGFSGSGDSGSSGGSSLQSYSGESSVNVLVNEDSSRHVSNLAQESSKDTRDCLKYESKDKTPEIIREEATFKNTQKIHVNNFTIQSRSANIQYAIYPNQSVDLYFSSNSPWNSISLPGNSIIYSSWNYYVQRNENVATLVKDSDGTSKIHPSYPSTKVYAYSTGEFSFEGSSYNVYWKEKQPVGSQEMQNIALSTGDITTGIFVGVSNVEPGEVKIRSIIPGQSISYQDTRRSVRRIQYSALVLSVHEYDEENKTAKINVTLTGINGKGINTHQREGVIKIQYEDTTKIVETNSRGRAFVELQNVSSGTVIRGKYRSAVWWKTPSFKTAYTNSNDVVHLPPQVSVSEWLMVIFKIFGGILVFLFVIHMALSVFGRDFFGDLRQFFK